VVGEALGRKMATVCELDIGLTIELGSAPSQKVVAAETRIP